MPRGASPKRERQYKHIKQSAKSSGRYGARAEEVAARTGKKIRRQKGENKSKPARHSKPRSTKARSKASLPRRKSAGGGFAGLSQQRQREIAAEGGRAAHKRGTAH